MVTGNGKVVIKKILLNVWKDEICLYRKLYLEHIDFKLANVFSFTGNQQAIKDLGL